MLLEFVVQRIPLILLKRTRYLGHQHYPSYQKQRGSAGADSLTSPDPPPTPFSRTSTLSPKKYKNSMSGDAQNLHVQVFLFEPIVSVWIMQCPVI